MLSKFIPDFFSLQVYSRSGKEFFSVFLKFVPKNKFQFHFVFVLSLLGGKYLGSLRIKEQIFGVTILIIFTLTKIV